jgi:hypothetical protein
MCLIITNFQERTQLLIAHKQMALIVTAWNLLNCVSLISLHFTRLVSVDTEH